MGGIYSQGYEANSAILELRKPERRREKEGPVAGARKREDASAEGCLGVSSGYSV
jgi:hypothetical protein